MVQPPTMSDEQRKAALEKAVDVRKKQAEIKMKLKIGSLNIKDVIDKGQTDDLYGKLKIKAVIESLPGYGKKTAELLLDQLGIGLTKRIKGLGPKQRDEILKELVK